MVLAEARRRKKKARNKQHFVFRTRELQVEDNLLRHMYKTLSKLYDTMQTNKTCVTARGFAPRHESFTSPPLVPPPTAAWSSPRHQH